MSGSKSIEKISIAGSGNLAWHLATAFKNYGISIHQVYSPTFAHAEELAQSVGADVISSVSQFDDEADLILLCIKDDAVKEIAGQLARHPAPLVHTSGSISIDVFAENHQACGVLYPLQSFRKHRPVDWKNTPVCIESTDAGFEKQLKELAGKLSGNVQYLSSDQRAWLHLTAVMVSNFSNLLYIQAEELLAKHSLDFSLLHALILETARRLPESSPRDWQTGPARRGDQTVIGRHLRMLEDRPEEKKLYELMTRMIEARYKNDQ